MGYVWRSSCDCEGICGGNIEQYVAYSVLCCYDEGQIVPVPYCDYSELHGREKILGNLLADYLDASMQVKHTDKAARNGHVTATDTICLSIMKLSAR